MVARLGHTAVQADQLQDNDFDVLLECSGAPGALAAGLARLRENGRAAMVGMPKQSVELPLSQLNPKELTIALVNRYAHSWPVAMDLVASGRVRTDGLVTGEFTLDETAQALMAAREIPGTLKAMIFPQRRSDG